MTVSFFIDLVLVKAGRRFGVECKRVDAPRLTPSLRIALEDVGLQQIAVVYPGTRRYRLAGRIAAVPMREVPFGWRGLFPSRS